MLKKSVPPFHFSSQQDLRDRSSDSRSMDIVPVVIKSEPDLEDDDGSLVIVKVEPDEEAELGEEAGYRYGGGLAGVYGSGTGCGPSLEINQSDVSFLGTRPINKRISITRNLATLVC